MAIDECPAIWSFFLSHMLCQGSACNSCSAICFDSQQLCNTVESCCIQHTILGSWCARLHRVRTCGIVFIQAFFLHQQLKLPFHFRRSKCLRIYWYFICPILLHSRFVSKSKLYILIKFIKIYNIIYDTKLISLDPSYSVIYNLILNIIGMI